MNFIFLLVILKIEIHKEQMTWLNDLKQNILNINKQEQLRRKVYGEKKTRTTKTLKKSYFSRPKLLTDWEYQKKKKNLNTNRPSRDVHVKQFSQQDDYNKPWNKLKYEHKINRVIQYVRQNQLSTQVKKDLIQLTKSRKIKVEYEDGEIKKVMNLEE